MQCKYSVLGRTRLSMKIKVVRFSTYTGIMCCDHCYRPQRSCGQGYVFTRVCDSVHRGGLQAGPPRPGRHPPGTRQTPRDQADTTPQDQADTHPPPGQGEPPQAGRTPPGQGEPPRKKTAAYGQWAAGTHPTGMHSCLNHVRTFCLRNELSPMMISATCEKNIKRQASLSFELYAWISAMCNQVPRSGKNLTRASLLNFMLESLLCVIKCHEVVKISNKNVFQ